MWFLTLLKVSVKFLLHYTVRRATNIFGIVASAGKLAKSVVKSKAIFEQMKSLVKKQGLRVLGKANYIRTFAKKGFMEANKRFLINKIPMEFRKVAWFVNSFNKQYARNKYIQEVKNSFWANVKHNGRINTDEINKLMKIRPQNDKEKAIKEEALNKTFWFYVKSPQTGSFSAMPQFANIQKKTYGVPIKSQIFDNYIRYYRFDNLGQRHWPIVEGAINTEDYGHDIYPYIRSEVPAYIKILLKDLVYENNI